MKIFKFLFAFALVASLASCSKDGDISEGNIMGEWTVTEISYEGTSVSTVQGEEIATIFTGSGFDMDLKISFAEEPKEYTAQGDYSIMLEMEVAGQQVELPWSNVGFIGNGDWSISGDQMTVTNSTGETQTATIVELTETKMVIKWDFSEVTSQQGVTVTQNVNGTYTFEK